MPAAVSTRVVLLTLAVLFALLLLELSALRAPAASGADAAANEAALRDAVLDRLAASFHKARARNVVGSVRTVAACAVGPLAAPNGCERALSRVSVTRVRSDTREWSDNRTTVVGPIPDKEHTKHGLLGTSARAIKTHA